MEKKARNDRVFRAVWLATSKSTCHRLFVLARGRGKGPGPRVGWGVGGGGCTNRSRNTTVRGYGRRIETRVMDLASLTQP